MISLLIVIAFLVAFNLWWRAHTLFGYLVGGWVIVEGTRGFRGAAWLALVFLVLMMVVRPWPVVLIPWLLLVPYTRMRAKHA